MAFSESVKTLARKKAHFLCVICRETPFVDVHHIIPPSDGGSDELENAAPLCAGCHDAYGNNPDKRKQIRDMRDQWYEICEQRYKAPQVPLLLEKLEKIDELYERSKEERAKNTRIFKEMQNSLSEFLTMAADSLKTARTYNEISSTANYVGTASTLARGFPGNTLCKYCGTINFSERDRCMRCGKPLYGF